MIYKYLPWECCSASPMKYVAGVVLHFVSAKWVMPSDQFNPHLIWWMLNDLNMGKDGRHTRLIKEPNRTYASYHWLITREHGAPWELVHQYYQAYHAGGSEFKGQKLCNGFMLGIGMIATADSGYLPNQYATCATLCIDLMKQHGFPAENIVGHSDVARPVGRKVDPGPLWDWEDFRARLSYT